MKLAISVSGGLDSVVAYWLAKRAVKEKWSLEGLVLGQTPSGTFTDLIPVYIEMGVPYEWKELEALNNLNISPMIMPVNIIGSHNVPDKANVMIPGRNAVIATVLSTLSPDVIWLSAVKGESHVWSTDKNSTFFDFMTAFLSYVHSPYQRRMVVTTPWENVSKLDVVRKALEMGYSPEAIMKTSSCLNGDPQYGKNCGDCIVCMRRKGIFKACGFEESYHQDPFESPNGKAALANLQDAWDRQDFTHYSIERINEVKEGYPELFSVL